VDTKTNRPTQHQIERPRSKHELHQESFEVVNGWQCAGAMAHHWGRNHIEIIGFRGIGRGQAPTFPDREGTRRQASQTGGPPRTLLRRLPDAAGRPGRGGDRQRSTGSGAAGLSPLGRFRRPHQARVISRVFLPTPRPLAARPPRIAAYSTLRAVPRSHRFVAPCALALPQ